MVEQGPGRETEQRPQIIDETRGLLVQARVLLAHKWTILGIAFAVMLMAAVIVFSIEPTYRATATVQIEPQHSQILNVDQIYGGAMQNEFYFATQYEVLHSRDLAAKAVERVDWSKYPEFLPQPQDERSFLARLLPFVGDSQAETRPVEERLADPEVRRKLVDAFQRSTQVQPVPPTLLVRVHFLSGNPELATVAANTLTDVYIESGFEAKLETARRATKWMESRLASLRDQMRESELQLQDFREDQDIVNVASGRSVLEDELTDNMQRLRDARRTMTELENTYRKIEQAGGRLQALQEIPILHDDDAVEETKKSYLKAQQELHQLESRYGPKHPRIVEAKAALEEARAAYTAQLRNAADGIRSQYEIAEENVQSLTKVVQQTRREIQEMSRKQYQIEVLQRETETNRELYDTVLTRFKEADVEGDFQSLRAHVVDEAILPKRAYKPRKLRWIGLAGFGGLMFGLGLVFIRERIDDSIKTADALENSTGYSVLASVPVASNAASGSAVARLVLDEPRSLFAEAIRTVRTGIVLSDLDHRNKRLLVTSAVPLEGKSCISSNLALAFGQMERVLLVDGDLRRPTLGRYLGLDPETPGLTDLLSGQAEHARVIQPIAEGVDFLPVGKAPPNPAELLTSERFRRTLDELAAGYDRIVIDSSPCQPVSDTLLLAQHADAGIFVIEHDSTGLHVVRGALKRLQQSRIRMLGAVLNRFDPKKAGAYEGGYYYTYYDTEQP